MMPALMNCAHTGDGWCLQCVAAKDQRIAELEASLTDSLELIEKLRSILQKYQSRYHGKPHAQKHWEEAATILGIKEPVFPIASNPFPGSGLE